MNAILPSLVIALALAAGYATWRLPVRRRLGALRASLEGEGESDIDSGRVPGDPSFEPTTIRFDARGRSLVAVDERRRLVHLASVRGSLVERARVPIAQLESVTLVEEGENADKPPSARRIGSLLLRITLPDERRSFYDIELLGRRCGRGSARHRAALALGEEWLSRLEPEVGERAIVVELGGVSEGIAFDGASAEVIESVDFFVDEDPAADAERAERPAADGGAAAPAPAAVETLEDAGRADADPVRGSPAKADPESAAGTPVAAAPARVARARRARTRPAVVAASLIAGTAVAIGAFVALRGGVQPTAADASVAMARETLPGAGRPAADADGPAGAATVGAAAARETANAASDAPALAAALPGWETRADELESGTSSVPREALEALLAELTEIRSLPLDQALAGRRDRLIERLTWMHERELPFYRQAFARAARRGTSPVAARTHGDGHGVLELNRHDFADAGARDAVWAAIGDEARALRFARVEFRVFRGGEPLASLDLAAAPVAPIVAGMD